MPESTVFVVFPIVSGDVVTEISDQAANDRERQFFDNVSGVFVGTDADVWREKNIGDNADVEHQNAQRQNDRDHMFPRHFHTVVFS